MAPVTINENVFDFADPGFIEIIGPDESDYIVLEFDRLCTKHHIQMIVEDLGAYSCEIVGRTDRTENVLVYFPSEDKVGRLEACNAIKNFFPYLPHFKTGPDLKEGRYYTWPDGDVKLCVMIHEVTRSRNGRGTLEAAQTVWDWLSEIDEVQLLGSKRDKEVEAGRVYIMVSPEHVHGLTEEIATWEVVFRIVSCGEMDWH